MQKNKSQILKTALPIILALVLTFGYSTPARAGLFDGSVCEDNGGNWETWEFSASNRSLPTQARAKGASSPAAGGPVVASSGECTYPIGNAIAISVCGVDFSLTRSYMNGIQQSESCHAGYFYGACADRQEGESNAPVTLAPCLGGNGSATFVPGACATECTVGFGLPSVASNNLPEDALATLYVRVVGEDGQPSSDSYTVCFNNPEHAALTIYRFVSGEWRALATSRANPICASASGDGAFYLDASSD